VSEWLFGLSALIAAPVVRLLLALFSRGFQRIASGRERRAALALLVLGALAFAVWALLTASLRARYGASQLLAYGLITAGLVVAFFAWFERAGVRTGRVPAGLLLGVSALGAGALLHRPSRAALELYHLERPTRWFARALGAVLPDADGDGVPKNLGFLRGGDCNDAAAEHHPYAFDAPGNGVDENCFAGDAVRSFPALSPVARAAARVANTEPAPWNVIVLALDSVRFDPRFANGVDPAVMPALARLAANSYAFSDFRTCAPRTRESVADLLGARAGTNEPNALQALSERGVHTAFIASDWLARHAALAGFAERTQPRARYGAFADGEVLAALEKFVADAPPAPFFVFSHLLGAHEPYAIGATCALDTSRPYARYQCALAELDRKLGVLLAALRTRGLAERTVLAITADHGEEFNEHGGRYHATTLYDEILHVPLVIHAPGSAPSLVTTPLSCLDFLPTLLGAAGFPAGIPARGHDRLRPGNDRTSAQFARTRPANEAGPFEPKQSAVVQAGYKLIWDHATGVGVYFDLRRDPGETRPLARAPAAVEAHLLALMDAWLSDQAGPRSAGERLTWSLRR
jgi:choline-sulfatase